MKNKVCESLREVKLESLRVGKITMYLVYSVFDSATSEVEIRAIDEDGEIYGAEIIVQDSYGYKAYKKVSYLFSERGASRQEWRDYHSHFVTRFAGGEYRDGTRGKIQDALDDMWNEFNDR